MSKVTWTSERSKDYPDIIEMYDVTLTDGARTVTIKGVEFPDDMTDSGTYTLEEVLDDAWAKALHGAEGYILHK